VLLPASCDSAIRQLYFDFDISLRAIYVTETKKALCTLSSSEVPSQLGSSLCVWCAVGSMSGLREAVTACVCGVLWAA
jgi:hypothetical protein